MVLILQEVQSIYVLHGMLLLTCLWLSSVFDQTISSLIFFLVLHTELLPCARMRKGLSNRPVCLSVSHQLFSQLQRLRPPWELSFIRYRKVGLGTRQVPEPHGVSAL